MAGVISCATWSALAESAASSASGAVETAVAGLAMKSNGGAGSSPAPMIGTAPPPSASRIATPIATSTMGTISNANGKRRLFFAPRCTRLGVTEGGSVLVAKTGEGYRCPGPLATEVGWRSSEGAPGRLVGRGFRMTDRAEHDGDPAVTDGLRPSWSRSSRPFPRNVMQPLQAFLQTESSSAILVLAAAAVALVWANAPFGDSYGRFWATELSIRLGARALTHDLRGWVSDGLMTVFFL